MAKTTMTLVGMITGRNGVFFTFEGDDPRDGRCIIYLEQWAARSAKVGDRVELAYRASASRGEWVVTQVLR